VIAWHLTCGHVCADLDVHDAHVAACATEAVARVYARPCPTCGAPPGRPCFTPGGAWVGAHGTRNRRLVAVA
jgi:hypothetical protein